MGAADETARVGHMLDELLVAVRRGHTPTLADLSYMMCQSAAVSPQENRVEGLGEVLSDPFPNLRADIRIKARTRGQAAYLRALEQNEITLVVGPAGTGKTYIAMAAAVSALLSKQVGRIILTRPAVEAGENLGFLPGDLQQKVNPYLRPLFDALYAMVDPDRARRLMDREMVEVAPLAFMRGRTLGNAFAILDEAQNTTEEQMKMFLTRLGEGSRAVITGDITQIDLPRQTRSGLVEAVRILENTPGVGIARLYRDDVVRHPLVQRIVDAYEADDQRAAAHTCSEAPPGAGEKR